jgi:chloramphenicol-sensitive protein RarD
LNNNEIKMGAIYASFSYLLWGLLPIYWKLLGHVKADEILANRVLWSFLFMILLLMVTRKWRAFIETTKELINNKKQLMALTVASILISINWFVYIWAVNNGHMIETSLGYYINPLVSVILGVVVLKEKLSKIQIASFIIALTGVLILTIAYGKVPWVSLILALSFGLYGLAKKLIKVESAIGLTLETMVVAPIGLIYILFLFLNHTNSLWNISVGTDLLLIGAGVATAVPLLYFAKGAQRIPLSMLGYIQYLAPTITLFLGIFIYHEAFTKYDFVAFICIWIALAVYSLSRTKWFTTNSEKWGNFNKARKKVG